MGKELVVNDELRHLIDGCINGNHKCQTLLYKKNYNTIYSVCLKMLKNKALAEDLTQDIFMKLIRKIGKFNGNSYTQLSIWIAKLSRNHVIDFIRARKKTENIDNISLNVFTEIIDLTIFDNYDEIVAKDINNAISKLPDKYRMVFELFYISNYSHKEIADELNLNVGTSKSNLFKAKKRLALTLSQYNNRFN